MHIILPSRDSCKLLWRIVICSNFPWLLFKFSGLIFKWFIFYFMTMAIFPSLVDVHASQIFIIGDHNFRCLPPEPYIFKDFINLEIISASQSHFCCASLKFLQVFQLPGFEGSRWMDFGSFTYSVYFAYHFLLCAGLQREWVTVTSTQYPQGCHISKTAGAKQTFYLHWILG